LIDFFEVFVHNGKSSIMGIKVVGGVSNGNWDFFTHFCDPNVTVSTCDPNVTVSTLKLRITHKLDFVLRINRRLIIKNPLLTELIFTLNGNMVKLWLDL
jgi:hypothetical protein